VSLALIGILGIILLILLMFLLGIPVAFAMAIVGFLGFWHVASPDAALNMISYDLWSIFSNYGLTVIPLFIFMGQIVFYSGVNEQLYNTAYKWIGHIKGGLAMATIMACAAFAAICGSNTATAATMTTVALPQMRRYNYNTILATGAIACGSTLGVVIPPSVVLILIGLQTQQSIAKLFYGGIGAGILLTLALFMTALILCHFKPQWGPAGPAVCWKEKFRSLSGVFEALVLFLLVILGMFFNFFTPSEAGAIGALLALVMALVQRKLSWQNFILAIQSSLRASCMVILIIAGATIFGRFLTLTRIPYELADWVVGLHVSPTFIMLIIFVLYILGGALMDALALLMITIPIFFPVAQSLGYDLLWFGVIVTVITTLGAITPPVAATTYVVAGVSKDIPLKDVFKGVTYFIPAYLITILILLYFPKIITFLPSIIP